MTTTTTKPAEAPEMPIADRLEHCAKFTGLDAVRELLLEAATAVRKRDAVVKLLEGELRDRAQATQADVTDAQLTAAYLAWCKTNGTPESFARAILALRPERVPMTPEQREVLAALVVGACEHKTRTLLALRAIEATEAQYGIGITAQAKKEGE